MAVRVQIAGSAMSGWSETDNYMTDSPYGQGSHNKNLPSSTFPSKLLVNSFSQNILSSP